MQTDYQEAHLQHVSRQLVVIGNEYLWLLLTSEGGVEWETDRWAGLLYGETDCCGECESVTVHFMVNLRFPASPVAASSVWWQNEIVNTSSGNGLLPKLSWALSQMRSSVLEWSNYSSTCQLWFFGHLTRMSSGRLVGEVSRWEVAQAQPQDTVERLHLSAALGMPLWGEDVARKREVWAPLLRLPPQMTWTQINSRWWMSFFFFFFF